MTDAAIVIQKPISTEQSRDVLQDLLTVRRYDVCGLLISPAVAAELTARVEFGEKKYGTRLQTWNGRPVRLDIRQELLDGIMYSHQGVMQGERVANIRNTLVAEVEGLLELERKLRGQS
jgi:hypothetical protein